MAAMNAEATPYIPNARDESYLFLVAMLDALGWPREWASSLEQRCYDAGRVWQAHDPVRLTTVRD